MSNKGAQRWLQRKGDIQGGRRQFCSK